MNDHEIQLLKMIPLLQQVLAKAGIHRTRTGAGLDITTLQMTALGVIYRRDNLMMSELAREMLIIQSAATRISDELEKRGLIRRINDKGDRRVTRLKITPKGRESVETSRNESQYLLSQVISHMTSRDQDNFTQGLQAFLEAVKKVEREYFLKCQEPECADIRESIKEDQIIKSK